MTCKTLDALPDYYTVYKNMVDDDLSIIPDFSPFVTRLLKNLSTKFKKKFTILPRRVFDEKTRYIIVDCEKNYSSNAFRIDKDTGMMLGNENKPRPRAYISIKNPEIFFDSDGKFLTIRELTSRKIKDKPYYDNLKIQRQHSKSKKQIGICKKNQLKNGTNQPPEEKNSLTHNYFK